MQFLSNRPEIIPSQKNRWYYLTDAESISFFAVSKGRKIQKIDENTWNRRTKNSYFLRNLMKFNKILWKNVAYDDIKSDQKTKPYTLFR